MNNKVGSFIINSILVLLFIGILFLPAASMGFLGVEKGEQVLSTQSVYDKEETFEHYSPIEVGQTSPSIVIPLEK